MEAMTKNIMSMYEKNKDSIISAIPYIVGIIILVVLAYYGFKKEDFVPFDLTPDFSKLETAEKDNCEEEKVPELILEDVAKTSYVEGPPVMDSFYTVTPFSPEPFM